MSRLLAWYRQLRTDRQQARGRCGPRDCNCAPICHGRLSHQSTTHWPDHHSTKTIALSAIFWKNHAPQERVQNEDIRPLGQEGDFGSTALHCSSRNRAGPLRSRPWAMAFARSASQSPARARARRRAHSWPSGTRPPSCFSSAGEKKSEPGPDFPDVVVTAAKAIADDLHHQTIERLDALAADGKLKEICNAQKDP